MPERADLHPGTKKRATSSFQFSRKGVHTGVEPRFERVGQGTRDHHVQDLQQAAESPSTCIGTSSGPRITSCSDSMRGPLPIKLLHCCTVFSPSCRALPTVGSGNRRLGRQGASLPEGACRQRTCPRVRHLDSPRAEHPLPHSRRQRGLRGCRGQQWITPGTRDHAAWRRDPGPNPTSFDLSAYWKVRSESSSQVCPVGLPGRGADLPACDCVYVCVRERERERERPGLSTGLSPGPHAALRRGS